MEATNKYFTIDLSISQYELLSEMFHDASYYRSSDQKTKNDYLFLMTEISNARRLFKKSQQPIILDYSI